jgi:hypothetical protein
MHHRVKKEGIQGKMKREVLNKNETNFSNMFKNVRKRTEKKLILMED